MWSVVVPMAITCCKRSSGSWITATNCVLRRATMAGSFSQRHCPASRQRPISTVRAADLLRLRTGVTCGRHHPPEQAPAARRRPGWRQFGCGHDADGAQSPVGCWSFARRASGARLAPGRRCAGVHTRPQLLSPKVWASTSATWPCLRPGIWSPFPRWPCRRRKYSRPTTCAATPRRFRRANGDRASATMTLSRLPAGSIPRYSATFSGCGNCGVARMSGSGACCFAEFATEAEAREACERLPDGMAGFVAAGLDVHPLCTI